jgi:Na+/H+-dicarboxylate symporter
MEKIQNKKITGMILGVILGIFYGMALDNIALGIGVGVSFGVAIGNSMAGEELIKDKKTRRRISWSLLGSMILGSVVFGFLKGNVIEGLSAGIGFSFVVGLKWDKLYDERMSAMFSKAARNAFVMINAGFSFVLFFGDVIQYTPLGPVPVITQIKTVIYLSWAVFLASWLYHANYKGE